MEKLSLLVGSVVGYIISALFNSFLVIAKETNEGIHEWLVSAFGHHWIGHGILVILVFILGTLVGMGIYRGEELTDSLSQKLAMSVVAFTVISVLLIAGFFAAHL